MDKERRAFRRSIVAGLIFFLAAVGILFAAVHFLPKDKVGYFTCSFVIFSIVSGIILTVAWSNYESS